ncbi:Rhs protein [Pseudomonas savastanoi pv. glycinea]|nr:Rhs protein [Pseudomonas savastanoi pv. glycinea]RMV62021.1 Rhs protein [Pseudomonas savastanoi pv. glycinea]
MTRHSNMLLGNHSRPDAQVQIPVVEHPGPGPALSGLLGQKHALPL